MVCLCVCVCDCVCERTRERDTGVEVMIFGVNTPGMERLKRRQSGFSVLILIF